MLHPTPARMREETARKKERPDHEVTIREVKERKQKIGQSVFSKRGGRLSGPKDL